MFLHSFLEGNVQNSLNYGKFDLKGFELQGFIYMKVYRNFDGTIEICSNNRKFKLGGFELYLGKFQITQPFK